MNDGGWAEANVVAAAVRILGGAQKVADALGVSRSQVYRWIKARSMARATYIHVAKLANLSGIDTGFLGGGAPAISSAPVLKESHGKRSPASTKPTSAPSGRSNRILRTRSARYEDRPNGTKQSINAAVKVSWQEEPDRDINGVELGRNEVQKGGTEQTCLIQSNGVAPNGGDHYGRRRTLRTKGQEESREHQP
jgi:transcriptional regulator with XRE-family HTH domain